MMFKKLFEKTKLVEFDYTAKYIEVERLSPDAFRDVYQMLKPLGWGDDEIKHQIMVAHEKGVYLIVHGGKVAELHDLPGRINIELLGYDPEEESLVGDEVEARFDPDDQSETFYISDETVEGKSL